MKGIFKHIFSLSLILGLMLLGEGRVWGTAYAKLTLKSSPEGAGKVYIGESEGQETTDGTNSYTISSKTLSGSVTFYIKAVPNDGYHFNIWTGDGVTIEKKDYTSTNVKAQVGATDESTKSYTVTANFLENYFAYMSVSKTSGTSGSVSVDGTGGYKNIASAGDIVFNLTAPQPSAGYYFSGWTGDNITFGSSSSLSTTATVGSSQTAGKSNASTYSAKANYAEIRYYATLSASTSGGNGSVSLSESTKYTTTKGGDITFPLTVSPATNYHLDKITFTSGSGTADVSNKTVTVKASDSYATGSTTNAKAYAIQATFAKNIYTVTFNNGGNTNATGSMAKMTCEVGKDYTLPENGFIHNISVTFDSNYGTIDGQEATTISSSTFSRWQGNDGGKYYSGQTINRTATSELRLTAVWHKDDNGYKAPFYPSTPVRGDRVFTGWYWNRGGSNLKAAAGTTIWMYESGKTLYAHYGPEFYAGVKVSAAGVSGVSPTVNGAAAATKNSDYKSKGQEFSLSTPLTYNGYHFVKWTGSNASFANASNESTTATVLTAATPGDTTVAGVVANYEESIYYAKLTASAGANGTVSVDSGTKTTKTSGGELEFTLNITPADGYHIANVSMSSGTGTITGSGNTRTVKVKASSKYALNGNDNAATYAVSVTFSKDYFYAKLTTAVSKAGTGSTGTAQVSADGGASYSTSATSSAGKAGGPVAFKIKATPDVGYQFLGWASTDGSEEYVSTSALKDTTVKGHTVEGQTQSYSIYAVFGHGTYKVHFDPGKYNTTTTMADQTFVHGTAQNLTANAFKWYYQVTYDTQGGTKILSKKLYRFNGWSYAGTTYKDKASVNLTVPHDTTLIFTAKWKSSVSLTLPTPVKKTADEVAYTFLGWYDAATGGSKIGDAGAKVSIKANQTLYAHWQECNLVIEVSNSANKTDRAVFDVVRSGNPATTYRISIPIGGGTTTKILKNVAPGSWTVTPVTGWSWDYKAEQGATTKTVSDPTTTFSFTFTSKGSTKKHDESFGTKAY